MWGEQSTLIEDLIQLFWTKYENAHLFLQKLF